jgi:hypothetical protein
MKQVLLNLKRCAMFETTERPVQKFFENFDKVSHFDSRNTRDINKLAVHLGLWDRGGTTWDTSWWKVGVTAVNE